MKGISEKLEKMRREKPDFLRQDFHKKRLARKWVKPRGLHSKVRLRKAGHPRKVSTGYGLPAEWRGLSKEGLRVKMIHNVNELENIDKEEEGIIVSGKVALKNKILLLKKAKENGVKVVNMDADEYLKRKEEEIKKRFEKKKEKEGKKKIKKKEETSEKKEEKLEEKLSEEEKKEIEKKEKDKLLTRREV